MRFDDETLWRRFVAFLGPMILTSVVQSLSGTVGSIYLGQMIGVRALAAATAFFPVMLVLLSLLMGMAAGTSVLVGRAFGAGDADAIRVIAGTSLAATLLMGIATAVPGVIWAPAIMRALGTPHEILGPATGYARVILASMPLFFAYYLPQSVLRGTGDTRTPMRMVLVSTAVGLVATPLLIVAGVGIVSPAVSFVAGMAVGLWWVARFLRRSGNPLAPTRALLAKLRIDRGVLGEIFHLGLPSSAQMIAMSVAELVLLGLINRFGADATAAYGAVNLLMSYVQFPAFSISITASVLAAQAFGAGRRDELPLVARTGLLLNVVVTGGLIVLAYLLGTPLLRLFITDPKVVDLAAHLLHVVIWSTILFGMAGVFQGVMRASGTVMVPVALSIAAIALVEVPLATWLSRTRGLDGIWLAYAATFCAMFVLQAGFYFGVWSGGRRGSVPSPGWGRRAQARPLS